MEKPSPLTQSILSIDGLSDNLLDDFRSRLETFTKHYRESYGPLSATAAELLRLVKDAYYLNKMKTSWKDWDVRAEQAIAKAGG